jgi:hypothetical protein
LVKPVPAGDIEGGAFRCGDCHPVDDADFVGFDELLPDLDSANAATVGVEDRRWPLRVDPPRPCKADAE